MVATLTPAMVTPAQESPIPPLINTGKRETASHQPSWVMGDCPRTLSAAGPPPSRSQEFAVLSRTCLRRIAAHRPPL